MSFAEDYFQEVLEVARTLSADDVEQVAATLADVRSRGGRIFVLGVGGSAASGSHLVNDLRKIANIETYTPVDNVSELTARINDEGWEGCFAAWLKGSRLGERDGIFILSVGGGNLEKNISPNLVRAIELAREVGASVMGIVGRDGGYTAQAADACVVVPTVNEAHTTPHTESFHSVVGHCLVSHPLVKQAQTKWESTEAERTSRP